MDAAVAHCTEGNWGGYTRQVAEPDQGTTEPRRILEASNPGWGKDPMASACVRDI
jgi:hypothetical protein